jgi:hypothetical protein
MNKIIDGRFFYIIVQEYYCPGCEFVHYRIGFGITKNPYDRIDDYIAHTFGMQSFKYLFYGPSDEINNIESKYKKIKKPYLLTLSRRKGKWKLEGLDPAKTKDNEEDIKNWVIEYIKSNRYETKLLKSKWLPYTGDPLVQKSFITNNPEDYLEPV